jgi:hypothetical protein
MLCSGNFVVVTSCDGLWVGVIFFYFFGGGLELGQCIVVVWFVVGMCIGLFS